MLMFYSAATVNDKVVDNSTLPGVRVDKIICLSNKIRPGIGTRKFAAALQVPPSEPTSKVISTNSYLRPGEIWNTEGLNKYSGQLKGLLPIELKVSSLSNGSTVLY